MPPTFGVSIGSGYVLEPWPGYGGLAARQPAPKPEIVTVRIRGTVVFEAEVDQTVEVAPGTPNREIIQAQLGEVSVYDANYRHHYLRVAWPQEDDWQARLAAWNQGLPIPGEDASNRSPFNPS